MNKREISLRWMILALAPWVVLIFSVLTIAATDPDEGVMMKVDDATGDVQVLNVDENNKKAETFNMEAATHRAVERVSATEAHPTDDAVQMLDVSKPFDGKTEGSC